MEEKWVITAKRADFNEIGRAFHIDPVIARLIRNRDVVGNEAIETYLYGTLQNLSDPRLMKDMNEAERILREKIAAGAPVRVVGDYDIDGIMAAYLLRRGLRSLGAHVDAKIPHRVVDGYGISMRMIREAIADGIDTIVTCDNGVSAREALKTAKAAGLTVIVTDHHEVIELPEADAVIDPHRADCPYPYKELCGAAVAWRLLDVLKCPLTEELLPFAAFATVGDIVDLTGENRIIVKEGLKAFKTLRNPGLKALASVNGIRLDRLDPYQIGFVLGPCINAAGRLESADTALDLLECVSEEEALPIALHLKELNDRRKAMTDDGVELAARTLEEEDRQSDRIYVIHLPSVHESIAGIIAGRIREMTNHPVFILTGEGETVKGSGRSVDTYSLIDGLKSCGDLLLKYGGHRLAAGLTLSAGNIAPFRQRINKICGLTEEDLIPKVCIDVPMPMSYVSEELLTQMELLKPYGKGNPEPLFAMKDVTVENVRLLGSERHVIKMTLRESGGQPCEAVSFRNADEMAGRLSHSRKLSVTYYPSVNEYRGVRTLQAVVTHYR